MKAGVSKTINILEKMAKQNKIMKQKNNTFLTQYIR
jgi:hypothetical protein